jgi:hypothetical protein
VILAAVPILFFLQTPSADAERRALEIWMETARAQTQASERRLRAQQKEDDYIASLNEFSKRFNRCYIEDHQQRGILDAKKCNDEAVINALRKFQRSIK